MSNKFYLNSSALFSSPSLLKGAARTIDMFGALDEYNYKVTEAEADAEALKRDWNIIGIDIANAIGEYDQTTSPSENTISATA